MSVPTQGESFAKLLEYLRKAQEESATMGHLTGLQGSAMDQLLAKGWYGISELLGQVCIQVTKLAQGKLQ